MMDLNHPSTGRGLLSGESFSSGSPVFANALSVRMKTDAALFDPAASIGALASPPVLVNRPKAVAILMDRPPLPIACELWHALKTNALCLH